MPASKHAQRGLAFLAAFLVLCVLIPRAVSSVSVSADSATLVASADTHVRSGQANTNFGSAVTMDLNSSRHGLLRFDLSGIPAGSIVTSATLTVVATAVGSITSLKNYHVHRNLTDWAEATATWNTPGSIAGMDFASSATFGREITTAGSYNWDVTADVAAFAIGTANHGWRLVWSSNTSGSSNTVDFATREDSTPENRPSLTVSYLPPGTPTPTPGVSGSPATLSASADAFLLSTPGDANRGAAAVLDLINNRDGIVRFDLSSIPTNASVTSATLSLQALAVGSATSVKNYGVHRVLSTWQEFDVTWNTPGSTSGLDFASAATSAAAVGTSGLYTWDVTTDVAAFLTGSATNNGWRVIWASNTTGSNRQVDFGAREQSSAANRPSLTILFSVPATVTPSPTATSPPTPAPTATATPSPTPTATETQTTMPSPTLAPTSSPTPLPTGTATPTATSAPTATPTPDATQTPSATATPTPPPEASATATSAPTPEASTTATSTPSSTATPTPTTAASATATAVPTATTPASPTNTATATPLPTASPTPGSLSGAQTPTSIPTAPATATVTPTALAPSPTTIQTPPSTVTPSQLLPAEPTLDEAQAPQPPQASVTDSVSGSDFGPFRTENHLRDYGGFHQTTIRPGDSTQLKLDISEILGVSASVTVCHFSIHSQADSGAQVRPDTVSVDSTSIVETTVYAGNTPGLIDITVNCGDFVGFFSLEVSPDVPPTADGSLIRQLPQSPPLLLAGSILAALVTGTLFRLFLRRL